MPQTYLPFENFRTCALVLDDHRLGNQRVDNIRVLQSLTGHWVVTSSKWFDPMTGKTHTDSYTPDCWYVEKHLTGYYPVNDLWRGFEGWLWQYHHAICDEYTRRGFTDSCLDKFDMLWDYCYEEDQEPRPPWLGQLAFHQHMQALLVEKAPKVYAPKFPGLLEGEVYAWPTQPAESR